MAESKQNTFFGIKIDEKKKKIVVPSKKTINLVVTDKAVDWKKMSIIILVIVVAAVAFAKFGILDPMAKKDDALLQRSQKEAQLAALSTKMAEYDKVESQYGRYSYGWMSTAEAAMLEKMQVLDVVESIIAPACVIDSMSVSQNAMSLTVHGVTLDQAREIVKQLKDDTRVSSAMVYSAVATDEQLNARISMTVNFAKEAAEQ